MRTFQEKKTKNNQSHKESIYTWMWYSSMNAKFFTSSIVLGRPQAFLFNTNIWCLTWKILRKQWLHTFSVTSIQTESKYSRQNKFNSVTLIPSTKTVILACDAGSCSIKLMQLISKKYNIVTDASLTERKVYLASNMQMNIYCFILK